jgi:hypothetical protein
LSEIAHKRILVAIETDATRYHGEYASRPCLLDRGEAEQMLAHISTDLASHFPEIKTCALSMAGALFDQTQLLRPHYPIYSSLESMLAASYGRQEFQPRLLSLGAESGRMPEPALQPSPDIPLGLLQTLPIVVSGKPEFINRLADTMEHRFLENGQLSAHAAKALEANFRIVVNHARFMTLTDLNAMLNLQLEHFGFLPLWQLLDAAINTPGELVTVQGSGGQRFSWTGNAVRGVFETFDHWAQKGAGRSLASDGLVLAQAYSEWTREYRQFLTTLSAHGVPVEQVLPDTPDRVLEESFLIEESSFRSRQDVVPVTEHSSGELGTVAVSVAGETGQFNYYPLLPSGLNELHASIRESFGTTAGVSFPGSILYDGRSRQLKPDAQQTGSKP